MKNLFFFWNITFVENIIEMSVTECVRNNSIRGYLVATEVLANRQQMVDCYLVANFNINTTL